MRRRYAQNQLDYILVRNNIKNWLNYSKTKGTSDTNSTNQHQILCMEIRTKFKKQTNTRTLKRHINYDINNMRGNTHLLTINQKGAGNEKLRINAYELMNGAMARRGGNNQIWHIIKEMMTSKQKKDIPPQEKQLNQTLGKRHKK